MNELKPCPFCGDIPAIGFQQGQGESKHYFVYCPKCLASTNCLIHSGYDEAEAIAAWNRRAAPDAEHLRTLREAWKSGAIGLCEYLRYDLSDRLNEWIDHEAYFHYPDPEPVQPVKPPPLGDVVGALSEMNDLIQKGGKL